MPHTRDSVLTRHNIENQLSSYLTGIEGIGHSVGSLRGLPLLEALKRLKVNAGPYPEVSLFEAANRIMTDLVLLYGVRWLLQSNQFPFSAYTIEFGHEDKNGFDLLAEENGLRLVGEAFNVAPSFFQGKKTAMLNKLRTKGSSADFSLLLFNHDAMPKGYVPSKAAAEHHIFVHVGEGRADILAPMMNRNSRQLEN
jgi:hypothetical protein